MTKKNKALLSLLLFSFTLSGCELFSVNAVRRNRFSSIDDNDQSISATILKDDSYESLHIYGQNHIKYDGRYYTNNWDVNGENAMTAISLKNVFNMDKNLFNKIENKKIKGLYKLDGLTFGKRQVEWTTNALDANGRLVEYNGNFAFKACGRRRDENDYLYDADWFTSRECHGESLTPETLFITNNMSQYADSNGFDDNSNPVALEKGIYTAILAIYNSKEGKNAIVCGLGLIKTGDF